VLLEMWIAIAKVSFKSEPRTKKYEPLFMDFV